MAQISLDSTFTHRTNTQTYTLRYTSLGSPSSPPLIFIHGTPWSSIVWHPFALSLASQFHVYLFDNPGFGTSRLPTPLPDAKLSAEEELDADLKEQSAVYAALFKSWQNSEDEGWNGRKPHVIAHDHGGLMALRALLLHDCRYASLCLIDVVAIPQPFGEKKSLFQLVAENRSVFEDERLADGEGRIFEGLVDGYIRDAAYTKLEEGVVEALKEPWTRRGAVGRKGFVRQMVQAYNRDVHEVAGRYKEVAGLLKGNLRVIWGMEDRWIPCETAERLVKTLGADGAERGDKVRLIENAGHLIMLDQPGRLGVELGLWLAESQGT